MGRSLRRHKKYRKNPIRLGVKRFLKLRKLSQKPSVLKGADVRVGQRLASGGELDWNEDRSVGQNYVHSELVKNPNIYSKQQHMPLPLKGKKRRRAAGEETYSDDDEMRVCSGKPRHSGKELPQTLSEHQRQIVQRLLEKHGDNVEAMVWDTKLNSFQHSAGKLRKLIESYHFWKPGERCTFRAPRKEPKKLRYYTNHLAK